MNNQVGWAFLQHINICWVILCQTWLNNDGLQLYTIQKHTNFKWVNTLFTCNISTFKNQHITVVQNHFKYNLKENYFTHKWNPKKLVGWCFNILTLMGYLIYIWFGELICLYTVKWFQVFQSNTNNSIKYSYGM